jgi:hypothetical protein
MLSPSSRCIICATRHPSGRAQPNEIWRVSEIADPEVAKQLGYVTPNVNVIYGFMDLPQQPIALKAPDSRRRYYMVQICDMWTNSFAYVGGLEMGYKGGAYALVGPDRRFNLVQPNRFPPSFS